MWYYIKSFSKIDYDQVCLQASIIANCEIICSDINWASQGLPWQKPYSLAILEAIIMHSNTFKVIQIRDTGMADNLKVGYEYLSRRLALAIMQGSSPITRYTLPVFRYISLTNAQEDGSNCDQLLCTNVIRASCFMGLQTIKLVFLFLDRWYRSLA